MGFVVHAWDVGLPLPLFRRVSLSLPLLKRGLGYVSG